MHSGSGVCKHDTDVYINIVSSHMLTIPQLMTDFFDELDIQILTDFASETNE